MSSPELTMTQLLEVARVRVMCTSGVAARIRSRAGLSACELASALGVNTETVYRWETGARLPTAPLALAYGDALDRIWLVAGRGRPMAELEAA